MKIIVTGSKGNVGKYVVDYCESQGAEVLGVDNVGRGGGNYLSANLTDFGETVDALHGLEGADAVIHLAAIADSRMFPTPRVFTTNMASMWNVFEAARILGIKRVVWASTIQVLATVERRSPTRYGYFPVDENVKPDPQNDYSLSKYLGEHMADMFARHYGLTIASLRFMAVMTPEAMATLPMKVEGDFPLALGAYCDIRDTARACYLATKAPLPAKTHEVFCIVAKDSFLDMPAIELAKMADPTAEIRGLQGYDSLISGEKAKRLLGFEAEYGFRKES